MLEAVRAEHHSAGAPFFVVDLEVRHSSCSSAQLDAHHAPGGRELSLQAEARAARFLTSYVKSQGVLTLTVRMFCSQNLPDT